MTQSTRYHFHCTVAHGFVPLLASVVLLTGLTKASTAAADEAKILFEAGIEAFHAEDYSDALHSFEASYAARPVPKVLFNIAMCQKAMYRYTDAIQTFDRFLAESNLSKDAPLYHEVISEKAALFTMVGRLNIHEAPNGAEVFVDGRTVGITPIATVPLDPGSHVIEIQKAGRVPFRKEAVLTAGETLTLSVSQAPEQGIVEIRCPVDGRLMLNQTRSEACPFVGKLPAGSHRLTLILSGAAPIERGFILHAEERLLLDLTGASNAAAASHDRLPSKIRSHVSSLMNAGGAASLALAAGAGALGAFFTVQGNSAYKDGLSAIDDRDEVHYNDINDNKLPAYRVGTAVSFAACGVLLTTGIALITVGNRKRAHAELQAGIGTIRLRF